MRMKELRELALAYRKAPINNIEPVLKEFFEEMDPQKKGFVAFKEFSVYMENLGRPELCSEEFFSKLNQDGSGKLDDMDVVTLFYIVHSRLPFCNSCKKFIEGTSYLVCVKCFHGNNNGKTDANEESFNVCTTCYLDEKFKHHHNEFLDPNLLLRHLRMMQPVAVSSTTSVPQDVQDLKIVANSSTPSATDPVVADNSSNLSANNQVQVVVDVLPERTKFSAAVVFQEILLYSFISVYYFFSALLYFCCLALLKALYTIGILLFYLCTGLLLLLRSAVIGGNNL
ncbi:uncharacterized protein LOC125423402 isoform X2 [Ziziphus jujuba]|uniref:Uncharacterized protein LOC125423402 isoform X2 n=1 Tax=Ziziphus jujuba TaxID=326968 RepID=A0ABM4A3B3_ZIZJJ|nr:uncharacterized protein LOC125423402 isoform X2 [Ziziphus jujuba]